MPANTYPQCCHTNTITCQHQHPPLTNTTNADATNNAANVTPTINIANIKTQGLNDKLVVIWSPGMFFIVHFIFFLLTNLFFLFSFLHPKPCPMPLPMPY